MDEILMCELLGKVLDLFLCDSEFWVALVQVFLEGFIVFIVKGLLLMLLLLNNIIIIL